MDVRPGTVGLFGAFVDAKCNDLRELQGEHKFCSVKGYACRISVKRVSCAELRKMSVILLMDLLID